MASIGALVSVLGLSSLTLANASEQGSGQQPGADGLVTGPTTMAAGISQNGWPANSNPAAINVQSFPVPGSGRNISVKAGDVSGILIGLATKFQTQVEALGPSTGGYNYRPIAGSSTLSNHSSGTAIDLNWDKHPQGVHGTFTAAQVAKIRSILAPCGSVVRWGGDYTSTVDEMHFEINVPPGSPGLSTCASAMSGGGVRHGSSSQGVYYPGDSSFHLASTLSSKATSAYALSFGSRTENAAPLVGDWNGNGTESVGVYYPATAGFRLTDSLNPGSSANYSFSYGSPAAHAVPLVGDWNGNRTETIGVYYPSDGSFHLNNSVPVSSTNIAFKYGPTNAGTVPIAGDWNGDGVDTVGLYYPSDSTFHLTDSPSGGTSNRQFQFGPNNVNAKPVVGDWDGDSVDTVGLYFPGDGTFHLTDSPNGGGSDYAFAWGPTNLNAVPVTGNWDGR